MPHACFVRVRSLLHKRPQADESLGQFLDYCTYGHMIDNVVLIVTGTLHERDVNELLEKCHPLGMFDSIATLAVAQNMRELYRLVLVDTPLAPYFSETLTHEDLDEMNIEIMRNTLYKAYLDDFAQFCSRLGGATAEIMTDLLAFEVRRLGRLVVGGRAGRQRDNASCGASQPCFLHSNQINFLLHACARLFYFESKGLLVRVHQAALVPADSRAEQCWAEAPVLPSYSI